MKELVRTGRTGVRGLLRAAVALLAALATAATWFRRVEVTGDSMVPTLLPGDRLVVRRVGPLGRLRSGDLVTLRSPPGPGRPPVLIKRVLHVDAATVEVRGDNPQASTDSRWFGPVPVSAVTGKVLYRYAPAERSGAVR